jgi:streptogramin lyase
LQASLQAEEAEKRAISALFSEQISHVASTRVWLTQYVLETPSDRIVAMTPDGKMTTYTPSFSESDNELAGITVGPDGALWFTESKSNSIGRFTPPG